MYNLKVEPIGKDLSQHKTFLIYIFVAHYAFYAPFTFLIEKIDM